MDSFTTIYIFTVVIFLGSGNLGSHLTFSLSWENSASFLTTINIAWGMNHIIHMDLLFGNHTHLLKCVIFLTLLLQP